MNSAENNNAGYKVVGYEQARPTPDILDVLDKDYPLETSIADLLDNSIDAGASMVLVRFVKDGDRLLRLCIADNGRGMKDGELYDAMTLAKKRAYKAKDLGMFGVGLKTASLSHANILTVVSKAANAAPAGRQWTKSGIKSHDWRLNKLDSAEVGQVLKRTWGPLGRLRTGTIVQWDDVYDFDRIRRISSEADRYIEKAVGRIQRHLGLKLHRCLEKKKIAIRVDVEELKTGDVGVPNLVMPTNPFPPRGRSGARGYPKKFFVRIPGGGKIMMRAHIWPRNCKDAGYRLGGGEVAEHQGFYFYRRDRLIQDGGWCGFYGTNETHRSLARVEVDIPDALSGYFRVRSTKSSVHVPATFVDALDECRAADGTTFRQYVAAADEVSRSKKERTLPPILKPGDGLPQGVMDALEKKGANFLKGPRFNISWTKMKRNHFFEIDQENRTVNLNQGYRSLLLRGQHGGKTDIPMIRTLIYFALEGIVAGSRIGPVDRFRLEAMQAALAAALKAEKSWA